MSAKGIIRWSCAITLCLLAKGEAWAAVGDATGAGLLGTPPSIVSVDLFSGAASGGYSFSVPPGRMGLQPELRIAYNSGSTAPTVLGRGWDFTFPYIQRSTRKGQPSFTWSDTFTIRWDGRLLDLFETCGPSSGCPSGIREFRTEIETFIKVRSTTGPGGATVWDVDDGSGRKYQFGNDGGSGVWAQINDFQWALNRIEDSHGNYLTVDWIIYGTLLPREIKYTGNSVSGLLPSNRVLFDYEGRYDETATRLGAKPGFGTGTYYRLVRLRSWAGPQVASAYMFRYSTAGTGVHTDMCAGVQCSGTSPIVCQDGQAGTCDNVCNPDSGFCGCGTQHCPGPGGGGGGGGCDSPPCHPVILGGTNIASSGLSEQDLPSLLVAIDRLDNTGTLALPSTGFSYLTDTAKDWSDSATGVPALIAERTDCGQNPSYNDYGAMIAEVNGDGLPDFVRGRASGCGSPAITEVYLNNNGSWTSMPSITFPPSMVFTIHDCGGEDHDNGVRVVDINGDGLDDLVRAVTINGQGNQCTGLSTAVWIGYGSGWLQAQAGAYTVPVPFTACGDSNYADLGVRFGDVNGDGLVDLVSRRDEGAASNGAVYLNTGSGWALQPGWKVPEPMIVHEHDWYDAGTRVVDLNGDGLVDIVRTWARNGVEQPRATYFGMGAADAYGNVWKAAQIVDPFSYFPEIISRVDVSNNAATSADQGVRFGDVNGDGLLDVIRGYNQEQNNGTAEYTKKIYLRRAGAGWTEDASWSAAVPYTFVRKVYGGEAYDEGVRLADMDGNGTVDFVKGHRDCGTTSQRRGISNDGFSHLMSGSTNGKGGSTTLSYNSSTSYVSSYITRRYLSFVLPVISSITSSDGQVGAGHTFATTYSYAGAYYHYARREFRGFGYVRANLPGGDAYTEQAFVHDVTLAVAPLAGEVEREALRRTSDDAVLSATVNTFNRTDSIRPYVHWLQRSDSYLYDWGTSVGLYNLGTAGAVKKTATAYVVSFDGNGFISSRETQFLGDATITGDELFVTDQYVNDTLTPHWWVGVPKSRFATDAAGGAGEMLAEDKSYYDDLSFGQIGTKGDLTRMERWTGSEYVSVGFAHGPNSYGHVTSRTDEEGHVVNMDYGVTDPTFTFLDRTRATTTGNGAPVPHQTTYAYDPRFGLVTNATSTGGGAVSSQYDAYARLVKSWTSLDSASLPTVCYEYNVITQPTRVTRYDREISGQGEACGPSGMIASTSFMDGLGNVIETKTESSEPGYPSKVAEAVTFDVGGRVHSIKRPFFSTGAVIEYTPPPGPGLETSFTYDSAGRAQSVAVPGVPQMWSTYSGWTRTDYDAECNKTETESDAFGRVAKRRTYTKSGTPPPACQPPNPYVYSTYTTTAYQYDRQGRLRYILDDTQQPQMESRYDKLGRQTFVFDRDSGQTDMLYFRDGTLRQTTDLERSRTYAYDELHRVLDVTTTHGISSTQLSYRYDQPSGGAGGIGQLTSVEDLNTGVRDEFAYDLIGRQIRADRRVDGIWFAVSQVLDALGRPRSVTYPDPYLSVLQYQYGADGRVSAVPGFASNIKHDEYGARTHIEYANGLGVDRIYDPTARWLTNMRARGLTSGSPDLVNTTYGYTPGGHLNSIQDTVGTSSQTFVLDNLYRLTSATGSYGTLSYSHDVLGNLTSKAGTGFVYSDSARPHRAMSTSTGLVLGYDLTGNVASVLNGQGQGWIYDPNVEGRIGLAHHTSSGDWASYVYGPDGMATKRTNFEANVETATILINNLYEKTGATYKKYIYIEGQRIAEWRSDGSKYFYLDDHLGGLNVVTDGSGSVVQRIEYKPYGETSSVQTANFSMSFMYAGARKDGPAGLYDFGARFYDPVLGRFLSVDPIVANPFNFNDLNPYGYARGNPASSIDVGGLGADDCPGDACVDYQNGNGNSSSSHGSGISISWSGHINFSGLWGNVKNLFQGMGGGLQSGFYNLRDGVQEISFGRGDGSGDDSPASGGTQAAALGAGLGTGAIVGWGTAYALVGLTTVCAPCGGAVGVGALAYTGYELYQDSQNEFAGIRGFGGSVGNVLSGNATAGESFQVGFVGGSIAGGVAGSRATSPGAANRAARGVTSLRPDVVLSGGRSGQLVKELVGPPSSVIRGGGARAFVTNEQGQVILDITAAHVKPVIPGQGFGPKRPPTAEELDFLRKILGGGQ